MHGVRLCVAATLLAAGSSTALVGCGSPPGSPAAPIVASVLVTNATLVRVVDGDTVVADISGRDETIRLIGMNTPETVKPNSPVECFGPEASARTKELLPKGTALHIERDAEARDDYGRLLGYVYRSIDGLFVNLDLVLEGFAVPLTIEPNSTHASDFVTAANTAQRAGLGLWAACD